MKPTPVIAVFDIGKTNKKLFLFDEHYKIVFEESSHFAETIDEDGFPCDDIVKLSSWVKDSFSALLSNKVFDIRAVSYSAYGASFVYLDEQGKVTGHLYNYLKEYPADLHRQFYDNYGGETAFANRTASPVLGNLNSGLQLYRLKYQKPDFFNSINTALHLPQFISYLVTGKRFTDMTSIGSHTGLWDFINNDYHEWVSREKILQKLAPIVPSEHSFAIHFRDKELISGIGLHDSSAALIPYLVRLF